jgi:hypothetical protein
VQMYLVAYLMPKSLGILQKFKLYLSKLFKVRF